jgi:probable rRNA maturation factor
MATSASKEPALSNRPVHSGIVVEISNTQGFLDVNLESLIELVQGVLRDEEIDQAEISVALVDNTAIRRINLKHLAHDRPTDVITFGLSSPGEPRLAGELIVSTEMAAATAAEVNAEPGTELALYVVHGLLHLCGFDDRSEPEVLEMRAREGWHLNRHRALVAFPLARQLGPDPAGQELARWTG